MEWKKVPDAATAWAGGVSPKTLYRAIEAKKLKAARIGAGRNLLLCEEFIDDWLKASVPHCREKAERKEGLKVISAA